MMDPVAEYSAALSALPDTAADLATALVVGEKIEPALRCMLLVDLVVRGPLDTHSAAYLAATEWAHSRGATSPRRCALGREADWFSALQLMQAVGQVTLRRGDTFGTHDDGDGRDDG